MNEVVAAEHDNKSWIVDTGATDHITNDNTWFTTLVKIKKVSQAHEHVWSKVYCHQSVHARTERVRGKDK